MLNDVHYTRIKYITPRTYREIVCHYPGYLSFRDFLIVDHYLSHRSNYESLKLTSIGEVPCYEIMAGWDDDGNYEFCFEQSDTIEDKEFCKYMITNLHMIEEDSTDLPNVPPTLNVNYKFKYGR